MNPSIPKVIHLCWFSGDAYPELVNRCINSWKRRLPDFKIKVWTHEMAEATGIRFVSEALHEKKWTFAADAVRLYALYTEGGIYMDSDIFIKKNFEDFLDADFITFIEYHKRGIKPNQLDNEGNRKPGVKAVSCIGVQAAFLASVPKHPFLNQLLDYYRKNPFVLQDGEKKELNVGIIAPAIYAKEAEKIGFKYKNETQLLPDGVKIWESKFFAGCCREDSQDVCAVHLCTHTWYIPTHREKIVLVAKELVKVILGKLKLREYVPRKDFLLHYVKLLDK